MYAINYASFLQTMLSKLRDKITEIRTEAFKQNEAEITARWAYEEAVSLRQ